MKYRVLTHVAGTCPERWTLRVLDLLFPSNRVMSHLLASSCLQPALHQAESSCALHPVGISLSPPRVWLLLPDLLGTSSLSTMMLALALALRDRPHPSLKDPKMSLPFPATGDCWLTEHDDFLIYHPV